MRDSSRDDAPRSKCQIAARPTERDESPNRRSRCRQPGIASNRRPAFGTGRAAPPSWRPPQSPSSRSHDGFLSAPDTLNSRRRRLPQPGQSQSGDPEREHSGQSGHQDVPVEVAGNEMVTQCVCTEEPECRPCDPVHVPIHPLTDSNATPAITNGTAPSAAKRQPMASVRPLPLSRQPPSPPAPLVRAGTATPSRTRQSPQPPRAPQPSF